MTGAREQSFAAEAAFNRSDFLKFLAVGAFSVATADYLVPPAVAEAETPAAELITKIDSALTALTHQAIGQMSRRGAHPLLIRAPSRRLPAIIGYDTAAKNPDNGTYDRFTAYTTTKSYLPLVARIDYGLPTADAPQDGSLYQTFSRWFDPDRYEMLQVGVGEAEGRLLKASGVYREEPVENSHHKAAIKNVPLGPGGLDNFSHEVNRRLSNATDIVRGKTPPAILPKA